MKAAVFESFTSSTALQNASSYECISYCTSYVSVSGTSTCRLNRNLLSFLRHGYGTTLGLSLFPYAYVRAMLHHVGLKAAQVQMLAYVTCCFRPSHCMTCSEWGRPLAQLSCFTHQQVRVSVCVCQFSNTLSVTYFTWRLPR